MAVFLSTLAQRETMGGSLSIRYSTSKSPARDRRHVPSVRSRSSVCDWRQRITMLFGAFFVLTVERSVAVPIWLTTQFESCGIAGSVASVVLSGCSGGFPVGERPATPRATDSVPAGDGN